jgi:hypothetical protein
LITGTSETTYPVWNTVAGGSSSVATAGSSSGNYYPGASAQYALDQNSGTVYTNFGACNSGFAAATCGVGTGLYLTPIRGSTVVVSLQFCTSIQLPPRDPITVTLEGSNQASAQLTLGSSWTLIYSGSSGLTTDPGRAVYATPQNFSNSVSYLSYRLLVTSKRGVETAAEYAEIVLLGH